jgi:ketosteroid isomerase-like protein
MKLVPDRETVMRWVTAYETAWRTAGTAGLAELFTPDATYLHSPYEDPIIGLDRIGLMWEDERQGPDEIFTLTSGIVAVDGATAVVRAEVRYGDPFPQEYRDLWVIEFDSGGRCRSFEEWPFWPGRPYTARGTSAAG